MGDSLVTEGILKETLKKSPLERVQAQLPEDVCRTGTGTPTKEAQKKAAQQDSHLPSCWVPCNLALVPLGPRSCHLRT